MTDKLSDDPSTMDTYDLVHRIHNRLAILEQMMKHPLLYRVDIRANIQYVRKLTAEWSRRHAASEFAKSLQGKVPMVCRMATKFETREAALRQLTAFGTFGVKIEPHWCNDCQSWHVREVKP